jgi:hypothetical protein
MVHKKLAVNCLINQCVPVTYENEDQALETVCEILTKQPLLQADTATMGWILICCVIVLKEASR